MDKRPPQEGPNDLYDDKGNYLVRFFGNQLDRRAFCHVCAFFSSPEEEYRILMPFIREGFERGEKVFHTVDPTRTNAHVDRLQDAGIDISGATATGQFEMRPWTETHIHDGEFDQERTYATYGRIIEESQAAGYPSTRFVTQMQWAPENNTDMVRLLEYEALTNYQKGPLNPVVCAYDLNKFDSGSVMDIMRTHPMILIDGLLQENPFFVSPDKFLHDVRQRRAAREPA